MCIFYNVLFLMQINGDDNYRVDTIINSNPLQAAILSQLICMVVGHTLRLKIIFNILVIWQPIIRLIFLLVLFHIESSNKSTVAHFINYSLNEIFR